MNKRTCILTATILTLGGVHGWACVVVSPTTSVRPVSPITRGAAGGLFPGLKLGKDLKLPELAPLNLSWTRLLDKLTVAAGRAFRHQRKSASGIQLEDTVRMRGNVDREKGFQPESVTIVHEKEVLRVDQGAMIERIILHFSPGMILKGYDRRTFFRSRDGLSFSVESELSRPDNETISAERDALIEEWLSR